MGIHDTIIVLDFGSQFNQLIVRKIRELAVYAELLPHDTPWSTIIAKKPKGIILSGSPSFVTQENAPACAEEVFTSDIPVLAICYGMQYMVSYFRGEVAHGEKREYGKTLLHIHDNDTELFKGLNAPLQVLMSHGDHVLKAPNNFLVIGSTEQCPIAAICGKPSTSVVHKYAIQFHPEVTLTPHGKDILGNFIFGICKCSCDWTPVSLLDEMISEIRSKVGQRHVLCAVSGGVDSSVLATLLHRAIGKQVHCIFVDTGLLRKNEGREILDGFSKLGIPLRSVRAEDRFFEKLEGISDPEKKRVVIGHEFIAVFEEAVSGITEPITFLAQGTLYPDVIESKTKYSKAGSTIKTHHNVGGLPERMKLSLLEPLHLLFKDEVRALGRELGLPDEMINRHPFPGPGLAVRILGEVSREKAYLLQEADAIFREELQRHGLYHSIWQAFVVLTPLRSVGVMGDGRTYDYVVAIRAVNSSDGMTAEWAKIPYDVLEIVSSRIVNEVRGINRVVYDITSKPPATIEWE